MAKFWKECVKNVGNSDWKLDKEKIYVASVISCEMA